MEQAFCIGVPIATRKRQFPVLRLFVACILTFKCILFRIVLVSYQALNSGIYFPQIRFRRGLPPGDGVLYYPGQVFSSSDEPVASLRLERLLSGLQVIIECANMFAKLCIISFPM